MLHVDELDRHRRALRIHCTRYVGDADAEDAVQETLLRGWRAASTFEGRSSTGSWLRSIATNVCVEGTSRGVV